MARPKDYDRQEVLERAVDVFWQKGFKACSVADVVDATGLNTASMYKEFGDKDGLFEESLDYYRQNNLQPRIQALMDEPSIKGIDDFLQIIINGSSSETYRGCLMMNHLSQRHSISPEASEKIGQFCADIEAALEVAFSNAQANGEIKSDAGPAVLASFVMCCVHGMVLYGRHPGRKGQIPKLSRIINHALGS